AESGWAWPSASRSSKPTAAASWSAATRPGEPRFSLRCPPHHYRLLRDRRSGSFAGRRPTMFDAPELLGQLGQPLRGWPSWPSRPIGQRKCRRSNYLSQRATWPSRFSLGQVGRGTLAFRIASKRQGACFVTDEAPIVFVVDDDPSVRKALRRLL